ncbi:hypothetical protein BDZ89DRAFT_1127577 [Hymenopellis radicata]|nr:hypothetical protein BDZ89DRAFT_1127577 [Hymenopellis radicata]
MSSPPDRSHTAFAHSASEYCVKCGAAWLPPVQSVNNPGRYYQKCSATIYNQSTFCRDSFRWCTTQQLADCKTESFLYGRTPRPKPALRSPTPEAIIPDNAFASEHSITVYTHSYAGKTSQGSILLVPTWRWPYFHPSWFPQALPQWTGRSGQPFEYQLVNHLYIDRHIWYMARHPLQVSRGEHLIVREPFIHVPLSSACSIARSAVEGHVATDSAAAYLRSLPTRFFLPE